MKKLKVLSAVVACGIFLSLTPNLTAFAESNNASADSVGVLEKVSQKRIRVSVTNKITHKGISNVVLTLSENDQEQVLAEQTTDETGSALFEVNREASFTIKVKDVPKKGLQSYVKPSGVTIKVEADIDEYQAGINLAPIIDKSELKDLIEQANNKVRDHQKYDKEKLDRLIEVNREAVAVFNKGSASEQEVLDAIEKLKKALADLEKEPVKPTETTKPTEPTKPTSKPTTAPTTAPTTQPTTKPTVAPTAQPTTVNPKPTESQERVKLSNLLQYATKLDVSDYSKASVARLNEAIRNAEVALDSNLSESGYKRARTELERAIEALGKTSIALGQIQTDLDVARGGSEISYIVTIYNNGTEDFAHVNVVDSLGNQTDVGSIDAGMEKTVKIKLTVPKNIRQDMFNVLLSAVGITKEGERIDASKSFSIKIDQDLSVTEIEKNRKELVAKKGEVKNIKKVKLPKNYKLPKTGIQGVNKKQLAFGMLVGAFGCIGIMSLILRIKKKKKDDQ